MTTPGQRTRWREASQRYRERKGRDEINRRAAAYRAAWTPEQRERVRIAASRWHRQPERIVAHREAQREWRTANKNTHRAMNRRWEDANPEKVREQRARRKATRAGIIVRVKVQLDVCGICQQPLTSTPYPDPFSTTLGHEPPLARAARDGWLIVTERPEHLRCNLRKHSKLDCELEGLRLV